MFHGNTFTDTLRALKMDLENLGYLTIFKRAACGHDDINCVQAAVDVLEGLLLHVSR